MLLSELCKNISKIDSKIPFIELGGCGAFAYHLHNILRDKYNTKSEIVYTSNGLNQFIHIWVKVDDKIIDNKGIQDYYGGYKTIEHSELKNIINDKSAWNNKFHKGWMDSNFKWVDPCEELENLMHFYL